MDTIGLFQLENLMISRSPYVFLDVRVKEQTDIPESILKLLQGAAKVAPKEVLEYLKNLRVPQALPILLVSEDEKGSLRVAAELESAGYANVYTVAGGVLGLVSEL